MELMNEIRGLIIVTRELAFSFYSLPCEDIMISQLFASRRDPHQNMTL